MRQIARFATVHFVFRFVGNQKNVAVRKKCFWLTSDKNLEFITKLKYTVNIYYQTKIKVFLHRLHWPTQFFLHGLFQLILSNLGALNPNLVLVFAYHITFLRYENLIFLKIANFCQKLKNLSYA